MIVPEMIGFDDLAQVTGKQEDTAKGMPWSGNYHKIMATSKDGPVSGVIIETRMEDGKFIARRVTGADGIAMLPATSNWLNRNYSVVYAEAPAGYELSMQPPFKVLEAGFSSTGEVRRVGQSTTPDLAIALQSVTEIELARKRTGEAGSAQTQAELEKVRAEAERVRALEAQAAAAQSQLEAEQQKKIVMTIGAVAAAAAVGAWFYFRKK